MLPCGHPYLEHLLDVRRPQQYTGGEWNLHTPDRSRPRVTLVYPDIYELGMSNFGLSILRHILVESGKFDVRRAFCPAPDMDEIIEEKVLQWLDLEGWDPVNESRTVGFSVPSEALFTNILHLLRRMGLPLRSARRDEDSPMILFGGGGLANPLPLAPFADLFFLGEVENSAVELFEILSGEGSREERLRTASSMPGVYVPSMSRGTVEIQRIPHLRKEHAPVMQLVPISRVSQDRGVVEIARGCSRGCRFCQASQLYRPVRERSVEESTGLMDSILGSTGWEKAGLMTLSLSDYSGLQELLKGMDAVMEKHRSVLSRPSMRPDSVLRMEDEGRITGRVTIAPEAGTDSLRSRINKPLEEKTILEAVEMLLGLGARGVKLYFIVGLPMERDEDVKAIGELALKIAGIARKHGRNPRKSVTVALSPFVPKAQTPLQWSPQMREDEIRRRIGLVRRICGRKVELSWNSPKVALLEAILSLGDSGETADILEEAVMEGARFDAWTDRFRWDIWQEVLGRHTSVAERVYSGIQPGSELPWDFVSTGVRREYLEKEYGNYIDQVPTPDCREKGCNGCGACSGGRSAIEEGDGASSGPFSTTDQRRPVCILRVRYSKSGCAAYTSHLDMVRMWGRVLRRSGLPVSWSDGYVSRPRVQFGPPLPLGIQSSSEYLDIGFQELPGDEVDALLSGCMPKGFHVESTWTLDPGTPALDKGDLAASYSCRSGEDRWLRQDASMVTGELRNSSRVLSIEITEDGVVNMMTLSDSRESRPDVLLSGLLDYNIDIERTELFSRSKSTGWRSIGSISRDLEKMFFES